MPIFAQTLAFIKSAMHLFGIISVILNLSFVITITGIAINLNSDKSPIIVLVYGTVWLLLNIITLLTLLWRKSKLVKVQGLITALLFAALVISVFIVSLF